MKKFLKQLWYFIWYDNSILSWIFNVVLAFVVIKFLVYPGLGFALSTQNPVVAVVSCSMEHRPSDCGAPGEHYEICGQQFDSGKKLSHEEYWLACGSWYEDRNIDSVTFETFKYSKGFNKGDLIILRGKKPEKLSVGDVIVFNGGQSDPIIHRIVNTNNTISTKGDKNRGQNPNELRISSEQVIGNAFIKIPYLGYVKILFSDLWNILVGGTRNVL